MFDLPAPPTIADSVRAKHVHLLVLSGIAATSLLAMCFAIVIRGKSLTELPVLEARQFQLGGMVGGKVLEAMNITDDAMRLEQSDGVSPTTKITAQTMEEMTMGTNTARLDDITEIDDTRVSSEPLLVALTEALKMVIDVASFEEHTETRKYTLTPVLESGLQKVWDGPIVSFTSLTSGSDATSTQASSSASSVSTMTQSYLNSLNEVAQAPSSSAPKSILETLISRLLQGYPDNDIRDNIESRLAEENMSAWSLIDGVTGLVAQISQFNTEFAGTLADSLLSLLPVDTEAIERVVSEVAEKSSISVEDMVPLVLPAIAKASGKAVGYYPPTTTAMKNVSNAMSYILAQGTLVLNQIVSSTDLGPKLDVDNILNQSADAVYAAAGYLNQTICAVAKDEAKQQVEIIVPCSYISVERDALDIITLNPPSSDLSGKPTAPWNVVPVANGNIGRLLSLQYGESTQGYESSQTSGSTLAEPSTSAQVTAHDISQAGGCAPSRTSPTSSPDTLITADFASVTPCPASKSTNHSCIGGGYACKDCPNGWFCPPKETPAQVVPCGLGWPCYHCSSGYFCATALPTFESTTCALISETSSHCNTMVGNGQSISAIGQLQDIPATVSGWKYLGCFQDAISRTLTGSKPMDYLRGSMSDLICINHCSSKGYGFAGTENGHECWCGSNIRDDAVRLPEVSCNVPCEGEENKTCGGGWIVAVFVLLADNNQATAATTAILNDRLPPETWPSTATFMATINITAVPSTSSSYQSSQTKGPIGRLLAGGQQYQRDLVRSRDGK